MKRVALIGINSKYSHTNLAIRYIRNFLNKNEIENTIYEYTINNRLDEIISNIYKMDAELLAFSVYVWNVEYVKKIVRAIKRVAPEKKIVLGGPEVSYNSKELMEEYSEIDYIIVGEGETALLNLMKNGIENSGNIYYRDGNKIKYTFKEEPIKNLDEIPFPYLEGELEELENRIIYYESSKGCPFDCSYCLSSIDKRVRFFSNERVKRDLKLFLDSRVKLIKFVDRTYNMDKKKYFEIWKYLIENYSEHTRFHFEISADLFDDEIIEFLKSVPKDYFQFEIGVQSTNKETILAINRKMDIERLKYNVGELKDNIHLHLDLIAGLPKEDYKTFKNSFNEVYELKADMVQLGFLKLLKGTQIAGEVEKYGYKFYDFPPYEIQENSFISFAEILKLKEIEEMLDIYYNSHIFYKSVEYIIKKYFENSFDFYEAMSEQWSKKGYFDKAHKRGAYFDHLMEFVEEKFGEDKVLGEFLKYDYLKLGKPSNFPKWYNRECDKDLYSEIVKKMEFRTIREAHKNSELESFSINVFTMEEEKTLLLFNYKSGEVEVVKS